MNPLRIGVIGCGAISDAYLSMARKFPILDIAACSDIDMTRAESKARQYDVPHVCTAQQMFADPSIDIVLNLTVPRAHAPITLRSLQAGKHVYCEKPMGIDRDEARALLETARSRNLRIGCAPDTFLGAGLQTARKLMDEGAIGRPVAFTAFMLCPGHEQWHPNPEFHYGVGGGPMFDMGPYYLTALLNLLGAVRRYAGLATIAIPQRTIGSEPLRGKKIDVRTPDHVCGMIEFECGASGVIMTSFATRFGNYDGRQPITLYGTEGTMRVPDPNQFDLPVHLRRDDEDDWREVPPTFTRGYGRSVGLADMAHAIRADRPHRASAEQAFAVVDLMQGFLESSDSGRALSPCIAFERPAPMPGDRPFGELDG